MLCAECYELAVVTEVLADVFDGVLVGALFAGALVEVVLVSAELEAAALVVESPLLAESLPLDVVVAAGALGDEDLERLSVL